MASEIKLRVKLAAACLIDGVLREAGEIVELPESIARDFGEIYSPRAQHSSRHAAKADADADN